VNAADRQALKDETVVNIGIVDDGRFSVDVDMARVAQWWICLLRVSIWMRIFEMWKVHVKRVIMSGYICD
jgi:hypothetical protein